MRVLAGRWWMIVWLTLVWVELWGEFTAANVLGGFAVAIAVLLAFPAVAPGHLGVLRPLAVLRFTAYFAVQVVKSNIDVAITVLSLSNRGLNEGIVGVRLRDASDAITTLVANAVTLTPGTLSLEVHRDPTTLYVHVLKLDSVDQVRRNILHLEWLAVQAFGDPATLAEPDPGDGAPHAERNPS